MRIIYVCMLRIPFVLTRDDKSFRFNRTLVGANQVISLKGSCWWPYVAGLISVSLAALVVALFRPWLDPGGAAMIFLLSVLWSAVRYGRPASIAMAVAAAATNNFFFFEPLFAFGLATVYDAFTVVVFLAVALTTGTLAARLKEEAQRNKEHAELARQRSYDLAALFEFSQEISEAKNSADLIQLVERMVGKLVGARTRVRMKVVASMLSGPGIVPLRTPSGTVGALEIDAGSRWPLPPPRDRLLLAAADMVAVALERAELRGEMEDARVQAETERLRAALLSSVSHDFRTPLGSIMGAASSLLSADADYSPEARRHMLTTILQSAERLNRYVRNILDLTTIQAGAVVPSRDWVDVEDLVGASISAIEGALSDRQLSVSIAPDLPLLYVDFVLIERVLINLLENAIKFSAPGSSIEVAASLIDGQVKVTVFNTGSELCEDDVGHVFERFYRGGSEVTGSGLGLAICKGFMRAHGGEIAVERDVMRGGVRFQLLFPLEHQAPSIEESEE